MNATSSSISLSLASFRSQTIDLLINSGIGRGKDSEQGASSPFDVLLGDFMSPASAPDSSALTGMGTQANSAAGRNMTLNDPESGYKMMTDINQYQVNWKAEFSELSVMDGAVTEIGDVAAGLEKIGTESSDETIKSALRGFIERYNDWITRFEPDMQAGGLLANTQAAGVARHELEASVRNILNGSKDGISGLGALGISVDPQTHRLVFDEKAFDTALASNRSGVVSAVDEFSNNFAEAAKTVTSDGKFIHRQLDNLDRALDYLRDNIASLRQEFGTGAVARTDGQVAKAVAAYEKMVSI